MKKDLTRTPWRAILGKRLRELRKSQRISQENLALEAGCAVSTVGRLERGSLNASLDLVEGLARALKVTPSEVFRFPPPEGDSTSDLTEKLAQLLNLGDRKSVESLSLIMDSMIEYTRKPGRSS